MAMLPEDVLLQMQAQGLSPISQLPRQTGKAFRAQKTMPAIIPDDPLDPRQAALMKRSEMVSPSAYEISGLQEIDDIEALIRYAAEHGIEKTMGVAEKQIPLMARPGLEAVDKNIPFAAPAAVAAGSLAWLMGGRRLPGRLMPDINATRQGGQSGMVGYHGSPHRFDKFQMDKIGTGEGAQAYGHGLYFAESPGVAKSYQNKLSNAEILIDGEKYKADQDGIFRTDAGKMFKAANEGEQAAMQALLYGITNTKEKTKLIEEVESFLQTREWATPGIIESAKSFVKSDRVFAKDTGSLYEVDIPDKYTNNFLDWDKPLSEQPESVQDSIQDMLTDFANREPDFHKASALSRHGGDIESQYNAWKMREGGFGGGNEGESLYRNLAQEMGDQAASEYLNSLGIKGIKYFDQASRGAGEGTRNLVVFDEDIVKILKRE